MIELGVTLDEVAVLRESRKSRTPDPVFCGFLAEQAGATAVNVQLRGDRRYVQERDVHLLRDALGVELNLVLAPTQEMIHFALTAKPDRITFVPERLETAGGGGLDVILNAPQLRERVREIREGTMFPVIFIDPSIEQVKAAHQVGALGVELSATAFTAASDSMGLARDREAVEHELQKLRDSARLAAKLELHVSIRHGITLRNVRHLLDVPGLGRINVGHDLVARAVTVGFESAVRTWAEVLWKAPEN
ncbi:MAG TPA: pyridoxine 5'-phosphate synthase [Vicinamibacteria bacterium]|nr:pyridoxine 5'-phosphate synthase [Vicinamibacteria bacterium]